MLYLFICKKFKLITLQNIQDYRLQSGEELRMEGYWEAPMVSLENIATKLGTGF